jgi:hypothetical protein
MFERAKTEVKIINEDIKPKDFMYVSEKEERNYEDRLRERDVKSYLEYISTKMLLLYSIKTDVLVKSALFKYIKGEGNSYYLSDIQVYEKGKASFIWGDIRNNEQSRVETSPTKKAIRPTSSPDRMQNSPSKKDRIDENREEKSISFKLAKENERIKTMIFGSARPRAASGFKLEPVRNTRFQSRK